VSKQGLIEWVSYFFLEKFLKNSSIRKSFLPIAKKNFLKKFSENSFAEKFFLLIIEKPFLGKFFLLNAKKYYMKSF